MIIMLFLLTACQNQVVSTPAPKKKATHPPSTSLEIAPVNPHNSGSIPDPQKLTQPVNTSYSKFELSTANSNIPSDIIEELIYFLGAGGHDPGYVPSYSPENQKLKMTSEKVDEMLLFHLSGFQPRESIRFLAYKIDQEFAYFYGWMRYQADENGKLIISYKNADLRSEYHFRAIGDISGECLPEGKGFVQSILKSETFQKCPNAPDQRVRIGDTARVCTKPDNLKVRSGPSKANESFKRIPPGTTMVIIDGPVCSDNWSWWKIRLNDGTEGWVAEGGDQTDSYYICPIN